MRGWPYNYGQSGIVHRFENRHDVRRLLDDGKVNRLARALTVRWRLARLIAMCGRAAAMRRLLNRRPASDARAAHENG
jgi:hypothetical protein